jgi:hypothetical protein
MLGEAASQTVREEFEQSRQIEKLETFYDEARELHAGRARARRD